MLTSASNIPFIFISFITGEPISLSLLYAEVINNLSKSFPPKLQHVVNHVLN